MLERDHPPPLSVKAGLLRSRCLFDLTKVVLDSISESSLSRETEYNQKLYLRVLLDEIQDAILVVNTDGTIRFANRAAHRFFDSENNMIGRELLSVCLDHRLLEILEEAWSSGEKIEQQVNHRSGEVGRYRDEIWQVEAEKLSLPDRVPDGAAWLHIRDITSKLETEQIRRDFVANASHELRTPLSIITGYIETLSENDPEVNTEFSRKALKTMEVHGERISRIVDDMLTISKLERFDDLLKRKKFNLLDSIENMVSHLRPLIDEQDAKVKIDVGKKKEWPLYGDRYYWDQIFFNLIENALKQNQSVSKLRVTVKLRVHDDEYRISVCDNGVGIPASDLSLVFKRFYRVEKHHARTIPGTGLGLSIVKRAVESHHGTIKLESQPGVLTCFQITVPRLKK